MTGSATAIRRQPTLVPRGVYILDIPAVDDASGALVAWEAATLLPFTIRRFFLVHSVPSGQIRGHHAHRTCHQFLVCARGRCLVRADDGNRQAEYDLNAPTRGLYLPPMIWTTLYGYSADASLVVLASNAYDPDDYIRHYDAFLRSALNAEP